MTARQKSIIAGLSLIVGGIVAGGPAIILASKGLALMASAMISGGIVLPVAVHFETQPQG